MFLVWRYKGVAIGDLIQCDTTKERDKLVEQGCQDVTGLQTELWEYPDPKATVQIAKQDVVADVVADEAPKKRTSRKRKTDQEAD